MKNFLFVLVAAGLITLSSTQAADQYPKVDAAIQKLVPGLKADSIKPAPFEGFVEVLLGAQLIYVSEDGEYVIDGQLIEVATRKNLSESSKGEVRSRRLASVSEGERIRFAADGKKKHRITVFTDIDCGYCRRLHDQVAEYNKLGIEVDYLFFPRAGLESHSYAKAVSVWCAKDQNQAMTVAKSGEEPTPSQCDNPIENHYQLGRELGVTGTPALVTDDGTLIPGYVPPADLLIRLESAAGP
ncbi:MAG: thioredoxin fold domain-containing protein [Lysobacterales bacterium]